jgi:hypothetical protein
MICSRTIILASYLLLAALPVCHADEDCTVPKAPGVVFLPNTSAPTNLLPKPAPGETLPRDCEFYRWAWQTFLYSTQPAPKDGKPALLTYSTFEDVFKLAPSPQFARRKPGFLALGPRTLQFSAKPGGDSNTVPISDIREAGVNALLIDRNGNPVFYSLHMNRTFVRFVNDNRLNTPDGLSSASVQLEFPTGSVEFKSAWAIAENPGQWRDYFTIPAVVPIFKVVNGKIQATGARPVTAALIALHVVGVIEGHPEFIWATFEHVHHQDATHWIRDNAPAAVANPDQNPPKVRLETPTYKLYPNDSGTLGDTTPVPGADVAVRDIRLMLDPVSQKFKPSTPVYRMFPSSQVTSNGQTPPEDPEIASLNSHVRELFQSQSLDKTDLRSNYQLVGAVWLNTPRGSAALNVPPDFTPGRRFSNAPLRSPVSLLGGEDRLSSTAMESFTQSDQQEPNCFSCHDTQEIGALKASRLNVSHMLSRYSALLPH